MSDSFQAGREAGEQAATIDSLESRITALESKVDMLIEKVTLARGGLAVLIAIGSICAALAGIVAMLLHGKAP